MERTLVCWTFVSSVNSGPSVWTLRFENWRHELRVLTTQLKVNIDLVIIVPPLNTPSTKERWNLSSFCESLQSRVLLELRYNYCHYYWLSLITQGDQKNDTNSPVETRMNDILTFSESLSRAVRPYLNGCERSRPSRWGWPILTFSNTWTINTWENT